MRDLLEFPQEHLLQEPIQTLVLLEPQGSDEILEVPIEHLLQEVGQDNTLLEPVQEVVLAQRLLEWTCNREFVYPSQVYQFGPYCIRTRDQATKAISVLESHGWLIRVPGGMELDGQKRRDVWRVIREEATP